jgi:hypothetical protein
MRISADRRGAGCARCGDAWTSARVHHLPMRDPCGPSASPHHKDLGNAGGRPGGCSERQPPQSSPLLRSATVGGTRASAARASPRHRPDPVGHRHSNGRPSHPSRSLPLGECLLGTRWCSSLHDDGLGPRRACLDGSSIGANHAREQCNHHRSRDYGRRSLVHLRWPLRLDCQQPYGRADRERATAE